MLYKRSWLIAALLLVFLALVALVFAAYGEAI
jgi:cbb3-type cytochrome oxidase subunit 3